MIIRTGMKDHCAFLRIFTTPQERFSKTDIFQKPISTSRSVIHLPTTDVTASKSPLNNENEARKCVPIRNALSQIFDSTVLLYRVARSQKPQKPVRPVPAEAARISALSTKMTDDVATS